MGFATAGAHAARVLDAFDIGPRLEMAEEADGVFGLGEA